MRLTRTLSRWARDFSVFWRLAELRARVLGMQAEIALRMNAGDAAVMAVGAFAFIFVLATVQTEASPDLGAQQDATRLDLPARATGARQQECEAIPQVPRAVVVGKCGPWV